MNSAINLEPQLRAELMEHLFGSGENTEEGAFLLAQVTQADATQVFQITDMIKLQDRDYVCHEEDYLELQPDTWTKVIKAAHGARACLLEVHSHVGPWPAAFSVSDIRGLRVTVPHVLWRLQNRPYGALVFTRSEFDALLWTHSPHAPAGIQFIMSGRHILRPTNVSLHYWRLK